METVLKRHVSFMYDARLLSRYMKHIINTADAMQVVERSLTMLNSCMFYTLLQ
jgi:hypothetical protein